MALEDTQKEQTAVLELAKWAHTSPLLKHPSVPSSHQFHPHHASPSHSQLQEEAQGPNVRVKGKQFGSARAAVSTDTLW